MSEQIEIIEVEKFLTDISIMDYFELQVFYEQFRYTNCGTEDTTDPEWMCAGQSQYTPNRYPFYMLFTRLAELVIFMRTHYSFIDGSMSDEIIAQLIIAMIEQLNYNDIYASVISTEFTEIGISKRVRALIKSEKKTKGKSFSRQKRSFVTTLSTPADAPFEESVRTNIINFGRPVNGQYSIIDDPILLHNRFNATDILHINGFIVNGRLFTIRETYNIIRQRYYQHVLIPRQTFGNILNSYKSQDMLNITDFRRKMMDWDKQFHIAEISELGFVTKMIQSGLWNIYWLVRIGAITDPRVINALTIYKDLKTYFESLRINRRNTNKNYAMLSAYVRIAKDKLKKDYSAALLDIKYITQPQEFLSSIPTSIAKIINIAYQNEMKYSMVPNRCPHVRVLASIRSIDTMAGIEKLRPFIKDEPDSYTGRIICKICTEPLICIHNIIIAEGTSYATISRKLEPLLIRDSDYRVFCKECGQHLATDYKFDSKDNVKLVDINEDIAIIVRTEYFNAIRFITFNPAMASGPFNKESRLIIYTYYLPFYNSIAYSSIITDSERHAILSILASIWCFAYLIYVSETTQYIHFENSGKKINKVVDKIKFVLNKITYIKNIAMQHAPTYGYDTIRIKLIDAFKQLSSLGILNIGDVNKSKLTYDESFLNYDFIYHIFAKLYGWSLKKDPRQNLGLINVEMTGIGAKKKDKEIAKGNIRHNKIINYKTKYDRNTLIWQTMPTPSFEKYRIFEFEKIDADLIYDFTIGKVLPLNGYIGASLKYFVNMLRNPNYTKARVYHTQLGTDIKVDMTAGAIELQQNYLALKSREDIILSRIRIYFSRPVLLPITKGPQYIQWPGLYDPKVNLGHIYDLDGRRHEMRGHKCLICKLTWDEILLLDNEDVERATMLYIKALNVISYFAAMCPIKQSKGDKDIRHVYNKESICDLCGYNKFWTALIGTTRPMALHKETLLTSVSKYVDTYGDSAIAQLKALQNWSIDMQSDEKNVIDLESNKYKAREYVYDTILNTENINKIITKYKDFTYNMLINLGASVYDIEYDIILKDILTIYDSELRNLRLKEYINMAQRLISEVANARQNFRLLKKHEALLAAHQSDNLLEPSLINSINIRDIEKIYTPQDTIYIYLNIFFDIILSIMNTNALGAHIGEHIIAKVVESDRMYSKHARINWSKYKEIVETQDATGGLNDDSIMAPSIDGQVAEQDVFDAADIDADDMDEDDDGIFHVES